MKQLALELSTAPSPSLENFETAGNEPLWAALRDTLSQMPGLDQPLPLLVWGDSGAGKTHMVRALEACAEQRAWPYAVLHAASEADADGMDFDPAWRLVLMDDVDLWSERIQARAFQWLASTQGHVQRPWVVATASTPPADWAVRADVRSRLAQGLVFELQLLAEPVRLDVLRREAQARGLHLSEEVASFMLRRFSRDLGSLMALLAHADEYAMRTQRALTVPMLKSMLENE